MLTGDISRFVFFWFSIATLVFAIGLGAEAHLVAEKSQWRIRTPGESGMTAFGDLRI